MKQKTDYIIPHSGRLLHRRKRGMVLVLVLMIFALASIVASELSYQSHREVRRTANILHRDEAYLFAKGGEVFAVQKLIEDFQKDQSGNAMVDYLTESWATETRPYELDKKRQGEDLLNNDIKLNLNQEETSESAKFEDIGELTIIIEDLQARFNINSVQYKQSKHTKGYRQFENVINALMLSPDNASIMGYSNLLDTASPASGDNFLEIAPGDLALATLDWIDADSDSKIALGSEDEHYSGLKIPYRTAGQEIAHVSELMAINGFHQNRFQLYKTLVPKRTVSEFFNTSGDSSTDENEDTEFSKDNAEVDLNLGFNESPDEGEQFDIYGNQITLPAAESYWEGIKPQLAALPHPTKINVNTASEEVLQAVFSQKSASEIVSGREGSPYLKVNDIFTNIKKEIEDEDRKKYTTYLSVNSQYFLVTSIATIEETKFTLESTLYRDNTGRVRVISRQFTR